jgi:signal transduction histidine kinase
MHRMKFNPFITLPLGAALIGLAYSCFSLLSGTPYDSVRVEHVLRQLQLLHQDFTQDIGSGKSDDTARLDLGESYRLYSDGVSDLRKALPPRELCATEPCVAILRTFADEADHFLDDVDVFIRSAAVFQNSRNYGTTLVQKRQRLLVEENTALSKLASPILASCYQALYVDRAESVEDMARIRRSITVLLPHASPEARLDFELLQQHLKKLEELSPGLNKYARRIANSSAGAALDSAMERAAEAMQDRIQQDTRSQRVLLAVASALAAYLGLSHWQLRKLAHRLHASNEDLENRVVQRTSELAARNRDLAQAQKLEAVGQLAAGVAHELNTPMQYVHDNIEFLKKSTGVLMEIVESLVNIADGTAPPRLWTDRWNEIANMLETRGFDRLREELPLSIQDALHGTERIIQIVRAMSQFTHPGGDMFNYVDLNAALRDAAIVAESRCKELAALDCDLELDLPHVRCLPSQVNQVLLNLLVNAVDAVGTRKESQPEHNGRIILRSHCDNGWVRLEVEDNGTGMPDDIRDRIFEPFFTTKEVGRGTGQGLAIAWRIISDLHGGKIEVETTPGVGTTVSVLLPIDGADETCLSSQCAAEMVGAESK